MSSRNHVPKYRKHKQSGQAIVTLPNGLGGRRDILLGKYGTNQSRMEYAQVISEWEAAGRRLPQATAARARPLALERYPRITPPMLLQSTNKQHAQTGLTVRAKPIKWPNGFRFPYRPKPLGFLEEDLSRLDRLLAKTATERSEPAKAEAVTAIGEEIQPELTVPATPLPNGPVEPDKFCWQGVPYSLSRPLEHRLLSQLWIRRRISLEEGICELYCSVTSKMSGWQIRAYWRCCVAQGGVPSGRYT